MIEGVVVKKLKLIVDERGWLIEILRCDWDVFEKFGQVYMTTAYANVVKAWHMHKEQVDNMTCISGLVKLVLYDERSESGTKGEVNEFIIGDRSPLLVKIPPSVWHGFKNVGNQIAVVINIPTNVYNYNEPDEYRLPPDTDKIPYDWKIVPWLKHG